MKRLTGMRMITFYPTELGAVYPALSKERPMIRFLPGSDLMGIFFASIND
jgi:hypothetical protein